MAFMIPGSRSADGRRMSKRDATQVPSVGIAFLATWRLSDSRQRLRLDRLSG